MFNRNLRIIRILYILIFGNILLAQTAEEMKRFMDTYDKIKVDQQAQEVVKKGIEGEKDPADGPVRLIVEPGEISEYYRQKIQVIRNDLESLKKLLPATDTIPPIEYFGYNYFSLRDSIPVLSNVNISSDYILGYGDEIIISIWGQAEQHDRRSIDRDGSVFIDNVGLLYLGGKTLKDAETHTRNRLEKVYATLNSDPPSTHLELSLGKIKNINVIVSGHVKKPGNYIVNPSINLTNVLIAAGGIDTTGTLRSIKLQRSGTIVDSLDMYPLITGSGIIKSFRLLEGDIILVPPRHGTVAITGAILRSAYFEPKKFETLADLFNYSGGKKHNAGNDFVLIRSDNNNQYISAQRLKNIIENPGALTLTLILSGGDCGGIKSAGKLEKDIGIFIVVSCCLESILKNQKEKDITRKRKYVLNLLLCFCDLKKRLHTFFKRSSIIFVQFQYLHSLILQFSVFLTLFRHAPQ